MAARRESINGNKYETEESRYDYPREDPDHVLQRARTAGAVSISAELFEKLYLSPKNESSGQLRRAFGNPTPMYVHSESRWILRPLLEFESLSLILFSNSGLIGFLMCLSPLSCSLMGFRGASNTGAVQM
ncbi:hypothetical protein N0V82_009111 [Gnomoniopsis sp. IMI 355080]|nr:hypothetical protein N0V82_009111 [Gnomoniopsis sp. IMI 355080]